jgi:hypothetical protein
MILISLNTPSHREQPADSRGIGLCNENGTIPHCRAPFKVSGVPPDG